MTEQSSLYKYWTCLLGLAAIILTVYRVGLLGRYATLCVQENPGCLFIVTNSDSLTHLTDAQEWAGNCFFLLNHEYFFTCCALTSNWGASDIHIVDKLVNRHPVGSQLLHKISKTSLWTEPNKRKKNKVIEKKRCSIFLQSLFPLGRLSNTRRKTRRSRNQDKKKNKEFKKPRQGEKPVTQNLCKEWPGLKILGKPFQELKFFQRNFPTSVLQTNLGKRKLGNFKRWNCRFIKLI